MNLNDGTWKTVRTMDDLRLVPMVREPNLDGLHLYSQAKTPQQMTAALRHGFLVGLLGVAVVAGAVAWLGFWQLALAVLLGGAGGIMLFCRQVRRALELKR